MSNEEHRYHNRCPLPSDHHLEGIIANSKGETQAISGKTREIVAITLKKIVQ